jgi:hypothetical protein
MSFQVRNTSSPTSHPTTQQTSTPQKLPTPTPSRDTLHSYTKAEQNCGCCSSAWNWLINSFLCCCCVNTYKCIASCWNWLTSSILCCCCVKTWNCISWLVSSFFNLICCGCCCKPKEQEKPPEQQPTTTTTSETNNQDQQQPSTTTSTSTSGQPTTIDITAPVTEQVKGWEGLSKQQTQAQTTNVVQPKEKKRKEMHIKISTRNSPNKNNTLSPQKTPISTSSQLPIYATPKRMMIHESGTKFKLSFQSQDKRTLDIVSLELEKTGTSNASDRTPEGAKKETKLMNCPVTGENVDAVAEYENEEDYETIFLFECQKGEQRKTEAFEKLVSQAIQEFIGGMEKLEGLYTQENVQDAIEETMRTLTLCADTIVSSIFPLSRMKILQALQDNPSCTAENVEYAWFDLADEIIDPDSVIQQPPQKDIQTLITEIKKLNITHLQSEIQRLQKELETTSGNLGLIAQFETNNSENSISQILKALSEGKDNPVTKQSLKWDEQKLKSDIQKAETKLQLISQSLQEPTLTTPITNNKNTTNTDTTL